MSDTARRGLPAFIKRSERVRLYALLGALVQSGQSVGQALAAAEAAYAADDRTKTLAQLVARTRAEQERTGKIGEALLTVLGTPSPEESALLSVITPETPDAAVATLLAKTATLLALDEGLPVAL